MWTIFGRWGPIFAADFGPPGPIFALDQIFRDSTFSIDAFGESV